MTELDFSEIESVLDRIMGKKVSFSNMVAEITETGKAASVSTWIEVLGKVLLEQLNKHGETIGYLLVLIISAALLSTIAKAFKSKQISEMGFYMIFLLLFLIMMKSFGACYEITESVIKDLIDFMRVLMPAYLMAAAASAYRMSAIMYYEGFLMLIYYLQKLVAIVLLPAIRCYVLFGVLGYLGKEDFFYRGCKEIKKAVLFLQKAMIGVTAGLQMIQGMISPAIDEMKHSVFRKGISSLGSVGNVAQNVTDIILGSGSLLKNGIGVAGAVLIVSICLIPVVEVAGYVIFYHGLAIVAEPISDKRLTEAIERMGDGLGMLVKLLFTVCALFLLTIAIVCVTTGGVG